jgi:hypothetical protein
VTTIGAHLGHGSATLNHNCEKCNQLRPTSYKFYPKRQVWQVLSRHFIRSYAVALIAIQLKESARPRAAPFGTRRALLLICVTPFYIHFKERAKKDRSGLAKHRCGLSF